MTTPENLSAAPAPQLARLMAFAGEDDDAGAGRMWSPDELAEIRRTAAAETGLADAPEVPGYRVTGRLGEGGMGVVWRAVQLSTKREVALKVIGAGVGSTLARRRFEREVALAARLRHPHIARVYDSGVARGEFYCAMELVEGEHLEHHVARASLGRDAVLALVRDVCLAVDHAHVHGVIHRDLKPSNILVSGDGCPHILDFGLAKAIAGDATAPHDTVTQEGYWAGTPAFMSPEQAAGRPDLVDTRADIYSLGAILYLLLTGSHPHDTGGTKHEVLRRVLEYEPRPPRRVSRWIDRELETLMLKALSKSPDERYSSAHELAADIDRYVKGEPLAARRPTLAYVLRRAAGRNLAGLAACVLLCAVAAECVTWSARARDRVREGAWFARDGGIAYEGMQRQADLYAATLFSTGEMFAIKPRRTRAEFAGYVSRLGLKGHYPGVESIGFVAHVPPGTADDARAWLAREWGEPIDVQPDRHPAQERHPVLYLEPPDGRNALALGFDMSSEPARRRLIEFARDAGQWASVVTQRPVTKTAEQPQSEFVVLVPVYKGGSVPSTVERRRGDLLGFVYSSFRVGDLVDSIFGPPHRRRAEIEVFDDWDTSDNGKRLYGNVAASAGHRHIHVFQICVADRTLKVVMRGPVVTLASTRAAIPAGSFFCTGLGVGGLLLYLRSGQRRRQDLVPYGGRSCCRMK